MHDLWETRFIVVAPSRRLLSGGSGGHRRSLCRPHLPRPRLFRSVALDWREWANGWPRGNLQKVGHVVSGCPNGPLLVEGQTDGKGTHSYNMKLSQNRARIKTAVGRNQAGRAKYESRLQRQSARQAEKPSRGIDLADQVDYAALILKNGNQGQRNVFGSMVAHDMEGSK